MNPVSDEALQRVLTSWALPILIAGSLVDIVQCLGMFRRWARKAYRRFMMGVERRARLRLLEDGLIERKKGSDGG